MFIPFEKLHRHWKIAHFFQLKWNFIRSNLSHSSNFYHLICDLFCEWIYELWLELTEPDWTELDWTISCFQFGVHKFNCVSEFKNCIQQNEPFAQELLGYQIYDQINLFATENNKESTQNCWMNSKRPCTMW